jgi:hypothetical protein
MTGRDPDLADGIRLQKLLGDDATLVGSRRGLRREHSMLAFGGLLVCGALLALAAFAMIFRSPNPPRWRGWSEQPIALAVVAAFGTGLVSFIAGAGRAYQQGVSLVDLGLLAAVLAAAFVVARRLRRHARRAGTAAGAGAPIGGRSVELHAISGGAPANPAATTTEPPPSKPRPRAA